MLLSTTQKRISQPFLRSYHHPAGEEDEGERRVSLHGVKLETRLRLHLRLRLPSIHTRRLEIEP